MSLTSFRIVSGVSCTNSGVGYFTPPFVSFSAPVGGGETASGYVRLMPDTGRIYTHNLPAFSVGTTNSIISNMITGSGSFVKGNNDFLRVGNNLDFNDWSVFLNFSATGEKVTGASNILVSTMDGVNQKSGLLFGINNANRLFLEYIDTTNTGTGQRRIFVQNKELGENNIISLSADSAHCIATVCVHNIAKQSSYGTSFQIPGYKPCNTMFLAGFTNAGNNTGYTGFIGLFKDVLVLSGAANAVQLNAIAPLFCLSGYEPERRVPVYSYYPVVTGARFINMVVGTGITGYSLSSVTIPDKDGTNITGYDMTVLSGTISGTGISYQTSTMSGVNVSFSGAGEQLYLDDVYVRPYADSFFVMLRYDILSGDLMEVYSYSKKWIDKISILPEAFNVYDFYLSNSFNSNNANVYFNGLLQLTGIDYELKSGKITSSSYGTYKSAYDHLLYDEISGVTFISGWTGWSGKYTLSGDPTASGSHDVYLNGQKLISGLDFSINGNTVVLTGVQLGYNVIWASGTWGFPPARTGDRSTFTGTGLGYYHDFTSTLGRLMDEMVFVNGQRLAPGIDYLTVSSGSLLNTDYRPGGWSGFDIYTGDSFETGVVSLRPNYSNASSDAPVSLTPPNPQV
jgi:hypothetical protein